MDEKIVIFIKNYFKDNSFAQISRRYRDFKCKYEDINKILIDHLNEHENYENVKNLIKCIVYNIKLPHCHYCGKELKFSQLKNMFCSNKCSMNSDETKNNLKESCIKKYGVDSPMKSEDVKEKIKKTCLEKYGVEHVLQSDIIKSKSRKTLIEKYGVDNAMKSSEIKEKSKKTCLEKYGTEYVFQSDLFKEKYNHLMNEKYNVDYPVQNDEIKNKIFEKSKKTCLEKYGSEYFITSDSFKNHCLTKFSSYSPFGNKDVIKKSKMTMINKYGVDNPLLSMKIKQQIKNNELNKSGFSHHSIASSWETILSWKNYIIPLFNKDEWEGYTDKIYKWKCVKCNNEFEQRIYTTHHLEDISKYIPRCLHCYPVNTKYSISELEVLDFCKQYFKNIEWRNKTLIKPLELDIVIPEIKLSIEFNGSYWHSLEAFLTIRKENDNEKYLNYHLNKTKMCNKKGYRLIHVWEDEWNLNKEEIKRRLVDIFNGNEIVDYSKKLDRSWYNNIDIPGYILKEEISPEFVERDGFHVSNCGYLVYEKK